MKSWSDKYNKIQEIGIGASGKIYKVLKLDSRQIMAAKIISISSNQSELPAIEQEIKIMSSCNHPNIVQCYGVELFEGEVWILMQMCEGGSLADIMRLRKRPYNQEEIRNIIRQVLEGLAYLHEKGIVHRDLKASNLLYHAGIVKIADFGVSILNEQTMTQSKFSRIGSPYWMSPQVLSESIYNNKTDIWALGITAIELAEGEPPFSHQHPFRAIYSIQTHPPQSLKCPQQWTNQFNLFVKQCLTIDYKLRSSASQLLHNPFTYNTIKTASSIHGSPSEQSQSNDSVIMHHQIPKSIWEKDSFPHSQEKQQHKHSMSDTVVINDDIDEQPLKINPFSQTNFIVIKTQMSNKQNKKVNKIDNKVQNGQREMKVRELYRNMERQIKQIRGSYMQKIRRLYIQDEMEKQNRVWNSPLKKLKEKQNNILSFDHSRTNSEMYSRML